MATTPQNPAQDGSETPPRGPEAKDFKWLNRGCRGPSYTSYSQYSHLPYCSFEWGNEGYAGSCSHGGELLYLSQPSKKTGLLITDFGGPSTFGLEVTRYPYAYDPAGKEGTEAQLKEQAQRTKKDHSGVQSGSSFALGDMIDRGSFNYRYPVTEYYLELHPYQQPIEDRKEAIRNEQRKAKEHPKKKTFEIIKRKPMSTIAENSEEPNTEEHEGEGSQQLLQSPLHARAGNGSNDPTGAQTVNPEQAHAQTSGTQVPTEPLAAGVPPTETPTVQTSENNDKETETRGKNVGTCQMFSCAMGKRFYQILRIEELRASENDDFEMSFPEDSQIVLTMGGPVWFQSFNDGEHDLRLGHGTRIPSFRQMGKKSKDADAGDDGELEEKVIDIHEKLATTKTMAYWVKNKDKVDENGIKTPDSWGRGLEAQIYQYDPTANDHTGGYIQLDLIKSTWEADNGPDDTGLTAYNAIRKLKSDSKDPGAGLGQSKQPRSATFVAVIQLYEGKADGLRGWDDKPPLPEDFYDYIGANQLHENATSSMWERIFLDPLARSSGLEPVLSLAEFNMIGRSLEKILQVDMTPATFEDDTIDEVQGAVGNHEMKYSALVSNLFIKANVNLKAIFWKIRFLIRVHKFLSSVHQSSSSESKDEGKGKATNDAKATDNSEQSQQLVGAQEIDIIDEAQKKCINYQMSRIKSSVEKIVHYLAKALLEPRLVGQTNTSMMPDHRVAGDSNYYYVMMTIWYVWKYFHGVDSDWTFEWARAPAKLGIKAPGSVLLGPQRLPPDEWTFEKPDRDKVQLLQWFHYGSLLKLCNNGVLNPSWKGQGLAGLDLEYKVRRLANAAKMVSSAKLSSREPYVADDEIFDRLSFVSDELELEGLKSTQNGVIALLSMNRVKGRDYTRTLNPGWLPKNMEGSTSGPWEIHALCHHSRLVVLTKEEKTQQSFRTREHTHSEAEGFRENICNFLNAEGTLIPCWERAHAEYRKGWLQSEATSVVATTLVIVLDRIAELNTEDALRRKGISAGKDASANSPTDNARPEWPQSLATLAKSAVDREERIIQEVIHLGGLMKGQLDAFERFANESGQQPPVVWKSFRPPLTYHPTSFTNSLEDTPELYKYQVLRKRPMPLSLGKGIIMRPDVVGTEERDFDREDINKIFKDKKMRDLLFITDIKAARIDEDNEGFTWVVKDYHYKYFDDCKNVKEKDEKVKKNTEALEWAFYDSLVDQEVQHRFHTVKQLRIKDTPVEIPKEILELLVYVIHPESAACLGDHIRDILNFSRFSCQTGDTWVASITLRSWRVHDTDEIYRAPGDAPTDPKRQNSADDFYLPTNLMQVWEKVEGLSEKTIFKPEVASVILSTNSFGDFSKCTVVAEFLDPGRMEILATKARKVWQRFIHQPQTARCLVFFLLLGNMCEELTTQYGTAIGKLSDLLTRDGTFTKTVDDYPQKYELGVWSLDALYKIQSSLNATVASLLKAKQELKAQILAGPGQRSVKLERLCQGYLSKFEDNLVQLTAVNVELNRKIELNTRNKDATSAILTMRDSRTAISQNSTVQRLTYLTIGYLPIALMAAIFAIPSTANVLYLPSMTDHGRSWFVGSIIIISVFTYVLAVYIGAILNFLQNFFRLSPPVPGGGETKFKKKDLTKLHPNFWRDTRRGFQWMWQNWIVSGWRENEEAYAKVQQTEKVKKRRFVWIKDNWLIGDWKESGDEKKEKAQDKKKKDWFKWPGALRHTRLGVVTETAPTNPDSVAEEGRMNGAGSGNGTSTEGSEPPKVPEVSQNDVQDPPTAEVQP